LDGGKGVVVLTNGGKGLVTYKTCKGEHRQLTIDYEDCWLHIDDETNEVLTSSMFPFPYVRDMDTLQGRFQCMLEQMLHM
jgi:hypothetical protein